MSDVNELIKQAYAYGANVALQEAGYAPVEAEKVAAQLTMEKTAQGDEGMHPALTALLGAGAGGLLGAGGGALAGKLTESNLLRKLVEAPGQALKGRAAAAAQTPGRSGGMILEEAGSPGAIDKLLKALDITGTRGYRQAVMPGHILSHGPSIATQGGNVLGSAALGGAGGATLGAGLGGLAGALD